MLWCSYSETVIRAKRSMFGQVMAHRTAVAAPTPHLGMQHQALTECVIRGLISIAHITIPKVCLGGGHLPELCKFNREFFFNTQLRQSEFQSFELVG